MQIKRLYDNGFSSILVAKGKMIITVNGKNQYSPLAIKIMEGFQVELGRHIKDIIEAVKHTRLPLIIKRIPVTSDTRAGYQLIRMHTGNVDDKVVANISTVNDIITSVSFNRTLIKDNNYRKYNRLSVLHQLAISDKNCGLTLGESKQYRIEQVKHVLKDMLIPGASNVNVIEDDNQIIFNVGVLGRIVKFVFIHNKEAGLYELVSISLT